MTLAIPTEPIGSIPRPATLIEAIKAFESGEISAALLDQHYDNAVLATLREFEQPARR